MKTLDEVIEAFEYTYKNDPTAWTYGVDALNYLKEYKEKKTRIIDGFIELHQDGIKKLINTEVIKAVIDMDYDGYKSAILIQGSSIPYGFDETYDEIKSLMEFMSERSI